MAQHEAVPAGSAASEHLKVKSFEDFKAQYAELNPTDKATVVEVLRVAKTRSRARGQFESGSVPGAYGALISFGAEGLVVHIPLMPGILDIHFKESDLEELWSWLSGE